MRSNPRSHISAPQIFGSPVSHSTAKKVKDVITGNISGGCRNRALDNLVSGLRAW
jgi:hypothetical protein